MVAHQIEIAKKEYYSFYTRWVRNTNRHRVK